MIDVSSVQVQAALVAAVVSVSVFGAGELLKRNVRIQEKRDDVNKIFKKYADPLAAASVALLWRLQEIFDSDGKGFYLKGERHETKYEHYKAMSTLYRLACVLGWIQALRRELVFVHGNRTSRVAEIESALNRFSGCLAEGGHVELTKVQSLAKLWEIDINSIESNRLERTGIHLDYLVKRKLHEHQATSVLGLKREHAVQLRNVLATTLCHGLGVSDVRQEILDETHARAMEYTNIREAWIYRDWQSAIGDLMLRSSVAGMSRAHEVVGYGKFEEMCNSGDADVSKWLRRLYSLVDDLDPLGDTRRDARIRQLSDVRGATASIVKALRDADRKNMKISRTSLDEALKVLTS